MKATMRLTITLPYDPTGTGNPECFEDGQFQYDLDEATLKEFKSAIQTYAGDIDKIQDDPIFPIVLKNWLESDPSRFTIVGDKAVSKK